MSMLLGVFTVRKSVSAVMLAVSMMVSARADVSVPTYNVVFRMGAGGWSFMVDRNSIDKSGDTRRFVQVIDLGEHAGNEVRSRRSLEEADCKDGKTRTLEETVFDGPVATGKVLREAKEISEWSTEAEGSPGKAILTFVCGQ